MEPELIALNQKIQLLEELICESIEYNLETAASVISLMQTNLDMLIKCKENYEQENNGE